MPDFRRKRENADLEFRRGLEELVRGHLDDCVSTLASCTSSRAAAEGHDDYDYDPSAATEVSDRRRRRAAFDGDDLAESSAAACRHSRILSQWVARQAEEMITTRERRNRESELMALAGLHTVSMLDSSFLRESPRSPSSVERPVEARASSTLRMWRELEEVSRERRSARDGIRDEVRTEERDGIADDASEIDDNVYDRRSSREQSPEENERVREIARGFMASGISPRNESPRSEWLGENERGRVRLVREWVQMSSQQRGERDRRRRDGSVTDGEEGQPEHVRIRGRQARLDLIMRMAREREMEIQGLAEHRPVSGFPHRNRIQALLRGRFLRNGRPTEDERPSSMATGELGLLRQCHPVSGLRDGFRFRLESIVRGQASSQADSLLTCPSNNQAELIAVSDSLLTSPRSDQVTATSDSLVVSPRNDQVTAISDSLVTSPRNDQAGLAAVEPSDDILTAVEESQPRNDNISHQNTETHTTTELESNSPNDDIDWQESVTRGNNWQEESAQNTTEVGFSDWRYQTGEPVSNWQENIDQDWSPEIEEDEGGEDSHPPETSEWHENDSHETPENWRVGPSNPPRVQQSTPMRRVNRFIPPDDDNVYSMELRELLSRRSVSNLLSSGFRESLDQLIQSYVQRQGHASLDWDLEETLTTPASAEESINQQGNHLHQDQENSAVRPPLVLPSPPTPPRQPLWHSALHHGNWTRQNMHRTEMEWDVISDLRSDMVRLQQGMNHMQRMLEACMDMQLELQRSVRQEVSAALNRSLEGQAIGECSSDNGSKWNQVRKGSCCVCSDSHIDSLLYRCGHMCTCSKCADELVQGGGKCPLCRAPIIEVIRAYSLQ